MQAITALSMLSRSYFKEYNCKLRLRKYSNNSRERAWDVKAVDRIIVLTEGKSRLLRVACIIARWFDRAEYWLAHSTVCFITPEETL